MARIPKQKKKKREKSFAYFNGGGCEAYQICCENCDLIQRGGEQYHDRTLSVTPCACGHETALYEPQLR